MSAALSLSVRLHPAELRAIERAAQIVASACDGADLTVGREYDRIASRLRRLAHRIEADNRNALRRREASDV